MTTTYQTSQDAPGFHHVRENGLLITAANAPLTTRQASALIDTHVRRVMATNPRATIASSYRNGEIRITIETA